WPGGLLPAAMQLLRDLGPLRPLLRRRFIQPLFPPPFPIFRRERRPIRPPAGPRGARRPVVLPLLASGLHAVDLSVKVGELLALGQLEIAVHFCLAALAPLLRQLLPLPGRQLLHGLAELLPELTPLLGREVP